MKQFGKLIIFGSGETSETGKAIFRNFFLQALKLQKVAVLETPAGFQPNSAQVAQEVGQVIKSLAPDLVKEVSVIPARRKGTRFSPDNPEILKPFEEADFIFLGPGSPTYALRQLKKSLALIKMGESWAKGATLCFASAAAVIVGKYALPVYEIYKAGTDLYWEGGLNLLAEMGFDLTAVPHWNNNEGGKKLDTSRCFMGKERFNELRKLLGKETAFFGIDENTAVIFSPQEKFFTVEGRGTATLLIGRKALFLKNTMLMIGGR